MPELPEVETSCRVVRPLVLGRRMTGFSASVDKLRLPIDPVAMTELLAGRKVIDLRRRAKYLLLEATGSRCLVIHLGMTGSLYWAPASQPRDTHDRFCITFAGRKELRLCDPRRFGSVQALHLEQPGGEPEIFAQLGPEPLTEEFTEEYLFRIFRGRRAAVKGMLMDQRVVVGVGNIYASESLHMAGVRPGRSAGRVTRKECATIVQTVKQVLNESIKVGGTTVSDYAADGTAGRFQLKLLVYGKTGASCQNQGCKGQIKKRQISGRSSFYCPQCQR